MTPPMPDSRGGGGGVASMYSLDFYEFWGNATIKLRKSIENVLTKNIFYNFLDILR